MAKLWTPQQEDGTTVEVMVPRMIALPLRAAKLYHDHGGTVMPHELLADIEQHLAGPDTSLNNRDDWNLIKTWLQVAGQLDKGTPHKSHIAFTTEANIMSDKLIHRWMSDHIDATLGRRPEGTYSGSTLGGINACCH